MKKYLLIYAVCATALLVVGYRRHRIETQRLTQNQQALAEGLTRYRTRAGQAAASSKVLRLRIGEFERLRADDAAEIRRLNIRLRRLEATARHATQTRVEVAAPLRDTLIVRQHDNRPVADTERVFRWHDPWVTLEGVLSADSVHCRIRSTDTLRQVIHRIPRRFLFVRWGTKAIRQEIISSNPHTEVVYSEYIRVE